MVFSLTSCQKRESSYRCVGDYRRLNNVTKKDSYPLPFLNDFLNNLHGMTIFSAIDLKSTYHQVPMDAEPMQKTTITTPFGAFQYRGMNFGLRYAAHTFQRFINKIISGFENVCFAYVDDLLVASAKAEKRKVHLRKLFERLTDHGLIINAEKSQIGKEDLEFLGHRITEKGFRPIQSRVEAICNFPRPSTVTQLRLVVLFILPKRVFIPRSESRKF